MMCFKSSMWKTNIFDYIINDYSSESKSVDTKHSKAFNGILKVNLVLFSSLIWLIQWGLQSDQLQCILMFLMHLVIFPNKNSSETTKQDSEKD